MQGTLITPKLPDVGTSIFAKMSALANEHGALNLSQGFPDFPGSTELISLVDKYMRDGFNQYSPLQGIPQLREVISQKMKTLYDANYDPNTEICITSGATEALYSAITAVVNPGDEVILFEPAYDCYAPAVELNGGTPVYSKLEFPDYHINWEELRSLISDKTRMILLNSPQNPTSAVMSPGDIQQLEELLADTPILILSDEVYEHMIFDGVPHQSVAASPLLAERSFVVYSFGKTFHNTGWKLGYCLAPAPLMKEFQDVHQFIVFSSNTPMQHALAEFMKDAGNYMGLGDFYQQKRDLFVNLVKPSRFEVIPCKGTYFQLLGYKEITEEADTKLADRLTVENKIASIPLSVFYDTPTDDKVLRFCFAKSDETLHEAAKILCRI